eukprot:TRINITY_DN23156_c0_g2_i2.p1 TRINITY_DN23156_c0_g2~~TRINITY_DN23156_c0_g2_i2.p1  ORF type:complete len:316 (-),score=48.84 TRINITY_DN23156_c0_g2_i2:113-1060(-)
MAQGVAQQAFINALKEEYQYGKSDAVGRYFDQYGDNDEFEQHEEFVRNAPNKAVAIETVMRKIGQGRNQIQQSGSSSGSEEYEPVRGPIGAQPSYIRRDFVRKVYSILTVQLLITVAIVYPFVTSVSQEWVAQNMSLYYMSAFGSLALMIGVTCCCQQAVRVFPWNYGFLLAITLCMGVMLGFVSTIYTVGSVVQALATTALVFLGLTAYACFTKTDFTGMGPYLFAGLWAMMMFGFVMWIWSLFAPVPSFMHTVYALCGVLLFTFYIIYDTQLVIGGNHQHQFDVDDYAFAALNLYLDIVNMFLYILELMGDRR